MPGRVQRVERTQPLGQCHTMVLGALSPAFLAGQRCRGFLHLLRDFSYLPPGPVESRGYSITSLSLSVSFSPSMAPATAQGRVKPALPMVREWSGGDSASATASAEPQPRNSTHPGSSLCARCLRCLGRCRLLNTPRCRPAQPLCNLTADVPSVGHF